MNDVTWDWGLFKFLNFDGGDFIDMIMTAISGVKMWLPLYALIIYIVWRRYGWRGVVTLLVAVGVAMGLADIIAGIFKFSGPLKHLWEDFPVRLRPMFNEMLGDIHVVSMRHGQYGTISAHAATIIALTVISTRIIERKWFTWLMIGVAILICYSRIYLACHYPQDILLGAILGIVTGFIGVFTFRHVLPLLQKIQSPKMGQR